MKINTRKIETELKRLGWRRATLAKEMKLSRAAITRIMKERTARLSTLNLMAEILNVDGKDLLI